MKNIAINIVTKLVVVIMGLFVSSSVLAQNGNVREETARQVGLNFLRLKDGNPRNDLQLTRVDVVQYPNLYVYNTSENGFIVVASDNRMEPILAYSDEGTFDKDNVAPGANFWFEMYEYAIDSIVRNNVRDVDEKITRKWEDLINGVLPEPERSGNYPTEYGPLIWTHWGQGDHVFWENNYNKFCPWYNVNGKTYRAITGCVATAMAQVLNYLHVYIPPKNTYYSFTHNGNHVFSLNGIDGHINQSKKGEGCDVYQSKNRYIIGGWSNYYGMDRIAKMMLDCGLTVDMCYGEGESGAQDINHFVVCNNQSSAEQALRRYFGYTKAYGKLRFDDIYRWSDTLKKHISHNVPVLYGGYTISGGAHEFVCDGYDSWNLFHFNFGWNGYCDGNYYPITSPSPDSYSINQSALFIKPVPDDEIVENDTISMGDERSYFWCFGLINVYQGQQASIGENYIIYDRPGTYTLRNRCDNEPNSQTLVLNVIVLPNNTIQKSAVICKRSKFHEEYTYDYQGKTLTVVFDLSRDQTDFDGTKSFYEYFRDDNGNAVAKCKLDVTISGQVTEIIDPLSPLVISICDLKDSDGLNRGIYKWDANNDGTIDVECTASGDYEFVEPGNNGGCETLYYLDLTIEEPNISDEDFVTTCVDHYHWDKSNKDYTADSYGTYDYYFCDNCSNGYCPDLYILHWTYSAKDTIHDEITICFKDLPFEYHGHSITESGPGLYSYNFEEQSNNPDECDKYYLLYLTITEDCCKPDPECIKDKITSGNKSTPSNMEAIYYGLKHYYEYRDATDDFLFNVFNGISWPSMEERNAFWNLFQSLLDANSGLMSEQAMQQLIATNPYDYITEDYITELVERYNQSVMYWNEGHYTIWELPEGYNPDFIEYDTASMNKAYEAYDYAIAHGFSDVKAMYDNAYELLAAEVDNIQSSVCARVTVQFNQKMTMTREAFNGTLQIFNGHESIPMQNIMVDFRIEDSQGNDCTDLFQINTLSLDQITDISGDGSLAAQTNGTALVQFIPTKNAAPTQSVVYSFGGSFSFIDPFTGEGLTYPLYPVEITVNPSPDLYIDYFMQRDILGDDALTLDKVEPSVPAELGVIINNKGAGTAKNVILETAEPQIIDNEKGLAIDFAMYGASFNGSPRQLGLMEIPFGNIESGHTAVGEWLFTSSLLGHFVSYEAHVIHNSSYGNQDLSLVSSLKIHELIHPIYAYGNLDDGINDFLVNDVMDAYDMPDSIYFSQGGKTAVGIVDDISYNHVVTALDTIVTLTINPSRIGWNYGVTNDPGADKYDIVSCTRNIDNQEIPLSNVWQTFVTIPDGGDPVYENKLHIVDTLSDDVQNVTYTLVYSLKTNLLDVVEITGIPDSFIDYPLESFNVIFNEAIIDSTFTYEDMTLKCQNGPNLMDESVVVNKVNDTIYNVNISNLTNESGLYVLNVNSLNISDIRGYGGYNGKQTTWVQYLCPSDNDSTLVAEITEGEDYTLNGFNIIAPAIGVVYDTLELTTSQDCDSIVYLELTVNPDYINSMTLTDNLVSGWNWWSTGIEQDGIDGLTMLENSLGDNGEIIKSQNTSVSYYYYMGEVYWYGELTSINNENCYLIKVLDNGTAEMTGLRANPANHNLTITNNWNWIGYPVSMTQSVGVALSGFTPANEDIIKSQDASSTYYEGYGWYPENFNLTPGKGYLYKSQANENKILTYTVNRHIAPASEDQPTLLTSNRHGYANNLTVIASVYADDVRLSGGNIELYAFVGDEPRGGVQLKYFEPNNCYYAVLTVTGEDGDRIQFGIVDRNTDEIRFDSKDVIVFETDAVHGTIDRPYEVRFGMDNVSEHEYNVSFYPNPIDKNTSFKIDIPLSETVKEVIVTDILGNTIRHEKGDSRTISGLDVRGVYDIMVETQSGNIYHGRIIVK